MHDCLQDAVRACLVRFLRTRLSRRLVMGDEGGGGAPEPLAETEAVPEEGDSFATDNNAKAAELLAHPALWEREPEFAAALFDFVLTMGEQGRPAPYPLRRALAPAAPGEDAARRRDGSGGTAPRAAPSTIAVLREDPRDFVIRTPMHQLQGDLSRGLVVQSVRSGGPGAVPLRHTGNLVEFTHRGHRHCLDAEDAITEFGLERTAAGGVRLHHAGPIRARTGRFGGATTFGTLRYEYEIASDRPALLRVTVRFTPAPGLAGTLSRLRVTTACDGLAPGEAEAFRAVLVDAPAGTDQPPPPPRRHADLPAGTSTVHDTAGGDGAAAMIAIVQERRPAGFANGLLIRPLDPQRLLSVKATAERPGQIQWVLTRYAADGLAEGADLEAREDRLLLGGGYHADPAFRTTAFALAEAGSGHDLSLCFDQGAVLNAVATHLLLAAGGQYGGGPAAPSPARLARLRAWCDRHLDAYFAALAPERPDAPARAYSRELAFVALALDCLWRATGEPRYRARLAQATDLLLALLRDAGTGREEAAFRDSWSGMAFLDCHAASMLALARVALHGGNGRRPEDFRLGPALRRALAAIRLASGEAAREDGGGGQGGAVFDTVAVRSRAPDGGGWAEDIGTWSYKLGLTLRALRAVQAAIAAGAIEMEERERARLGFLATLCLDLLRSRIRPRGDVLEIGAGPSGGGTNVEAQAWTLLGLMPTDVPIARTAPGLAAGNGAAEDTGDAETVTASHATAIAAAVPVP